MLLRTLLFPLMMGICLNTAFAMEAPEATPNNPKSPISQQRKITSPAYMKIYNNILLNLLDKSDFQGILDMAYPVPSIDYAPVDESDLQHYLFDRAKAVLTACTALAEKNQLNPNLCIRYHEKSLEEISDYFSSIRNIKKPDKFQEFILYYEAGFTHKMIISNLQNINDVSNYPIVVHHLKGALEAYEKAMTYELSPSASQDPKRVELFNTYQSNIQYALFTCYGMLSRYFPSSEGERLLGKASQICHGFKHHKKKLFEKASVELKLHEHNFKLTMSSCAIGHPTRKKSEREQAIINQKNLLLLSIADNQFKENKAPLTLSIQALQQHVELLPGRSDTAREALIKVENEIKNHLIKQDPSDSSAPLPTLEAVYEHLWNLLGREKLMKTLLTAYSIDFVNADDVKEAILRLELFKKLEIKNLRTASNDTRTLIAMLKNICGDHEEWLSLERELQQKEQLKKDKKNEKRKRARQRRAQTIQLSLAEKKQQEEKEARQLELAAAKSLAPSSLVTPVSKESEPIRFKETFMPPKQSKLAKQQRHAEAEAKRNQDATLDAESEEKEVPALVPVARKVSKEEQLESILASSDKPLSELYNLTSLPLRIDREIEGETWQFTREEFKIYLEAMGCVYKEGRGSHGKVPLPKATHVMQGDTLITIWNDFGGGALTLPLWDKDYVPSYLKTQILEARKQLRALRIMALQKAEAPSSSG